MDVVERHTGGTGTAFGVPGVPTKGHGTPLTGAELKRQRAILRPPGARSTPRPAQGKTLSVGPRGGERILAKMTGHVLEAEVADLGQSAAATPRNAGEDGMALSGAKPWTRWTR